MKITDMVEDSLNSAIVDNPKNSIDDKRNEILIHQAHSNEILFRLIKELDILLKKEAYDG